MLSCRCQDGVLWSLLMLLNSKTDLLSRHDRASKLEVQTFKSAHLKCQDQMYWVPFCGVIILQSQPNTRLSCVIWELAPASAKIKASAENSNFRHTALFLSIFFQVAPAWQALPGHCPAVSGATQQTESALQREAAANRRGAVSANPGTVPKEKKVWREYSAALAKKSTSSLFSALGFYCCCSK